MPQEEEKKELELPQRRMGAQERYAQELLDYLWAHEEDILSRTADGVFYQGSIHMLTRRVTPSGQAGDVVNVLKESGAITNVAHGVWKVNREQVFTDEEGNPVTFDAPTFGHDSRSKIHDRAVAALEKRVEKLEAQMEQITRLLVKIAGGEDAEKEDNENPNDL